MKVYDKLIQWFLRGDSGLSSKAIVAHFTGNAEIYDYMLYHPRDMGDFRRCVGLLEDAPEWRSRIIEMAVYSEPWARIVHNWDRLEEDLRGPEPSLVCKFLAEL